MKYISIVLCLFAGFIASSNGVPELVLPDAKITIKVVNEAGIPVTDAEVGVGFNQGGNTWIGEHKSESIRGASDTNGLFSAQERCMGGIGISVQKEGFYRSSARQDYPGTYQNKKRWEPWNPVIEVVLKEIKNPIPMYVKTIRTTIPLIEKPIGFDLERGDFISPYGRGVESDFNILLTGFFNNVKDRESSLTIFFLNEKDGVQEYLAEPVSKDSLCLPHEAPERGYIQNWKELQYLRPDGSRLNLGRKKTTNFIFRVRTVLDKHGNVVKANYGKIHGDIEFGFTSPSEAMLIFTYYFNPIPNDRNIEFDPNKNLFVDRERFAP